MRSWVHLNFMGRLLFIASLINLAATFFFINHQYFLFAATSFATSMTCGVATYASRYSGK